MKKYPKLVQADKRGQIVIPKEIREELDIDETTGFIVYSISDEGILLKKIQPEELADNDPVINKIKEKSAKLKINPKNIDKTIQDYKKIKKGKLDII
ncbi:AbrB/MazE/SpoVT family DNA-binding domain-containing protein [Candidatus Woesearchaeota archaeon]|nr:AbrB/MazE/SpoVT family DNA-binding domain-containing protein [Candidatus Woesearchaeota archaeon]